jgi:hypothetical protein
MKPKCVPKIVLALLLATALPVRANLVTNGDFEGSLGTPNNSGSGGFGPFLTYNAGNQGIPGWTIGGNGADVWTSFQGTGNNVIDTNALGPGSLTQTFATTPGQSYGVSCDLSGGTSALIKSMDVTLFGADGVSTLTMSSFAENTSSLGGTFLPQGRSSSRTAASPRSNSSVPSAASMACISTT